MSSSSGSRVFHVVIFGATGFTGQYCARYLSRYIRSTRQSVRWAIAGRRRDALLSLRHSLAAEVGVDDESVCGVVEADLKDEKSLEECAAKAHVLLTCVGPYRLYGDPVIRACLRANTHYCDISGEPEFIEGVIANYYAEAKEKSLTLVSASAFDCIPADLGTLFTESEWRRVHGDSGDSPVLANITGILSLKTGKDGVAGHFGTYESLIYSMTHIGQLIKVRSKLRKLQASLLGVSESQKDFVKRLGKAPPTPETYEWKNDLNSYILRFPGADASVVRNSQYLRGAQSPSTVSTTIVPHYAACFSVKSLWTVFLFILFGFVMKFFVAKFSFFRNIALKFPKVFSFGVFSHDGPTQKQVTDTSFVLDLYAEGWKQNEKEEANTKKVEKKTLHTMVTGPEPGYAATSIMACQSALFILQKRVLEAKTSKMPSGVLTPGVAFASHADEFIRILHKEGVQFTNVHHQG